MKNKDQYLIVGEDSDCFDGDDFHSTLDKAKADVVKRLRRELPGEWSIYKLAATMETEQPKVKWVDAG